MTVEESLVTLLRGDRRCKPVILGRVHFYHFWKHQPMSNMINVPWVKDLRAKQFAMSGYIPQYLDQAQRYLISDANRFRTSNAFVAPTETFANEVMRWYGECRPWIQFANYPDKLKITGKRRSEVLYLDSSSTVFQEEFFLRLIAFFDELHAMSGIKAVVVAGVMRDKIALLPRRSHIKVMAAREYDGLSKYGLLCNLTNFQQAAECLPRKLLYYLHCGMAPLIHGTFMESIYYCKENAIDPLVYYTADEAADYISSGFPFPEYNRGALLHPE